MMDNTWNDAAMCSFLTTSPAPFSAQRANSGQGQQRVQVTLLCLRDDLGIEPSTLK